MNKLSISRGNSKLGNIPNISLTPGLCGSCAKDVPCRGTCYAHKAYRQYPRTRAAWDGNLKLWQEDTDEYWMQLKSFLSRTEKDRFRFHVAGDIPSMQYMCSIVVTAAEVFPHIKFLCYTKRYDYLFEMRDVKLPPNLSLVVSRWPGWRTEQGIELGKHFPSAYMVPKGESYTDVYPELHGEIVFRSPGDCTHCRQCWNLPHSMVKGVLFDEH